MSLPSAPEREWLEADGLGGFAMGTADLVRTRRYHGLLQVATTPPTGRVMLVNGFDAWVETDAESLALSTQRYAPEVLHPDGAQRLVAFDARPFPRWMYGLAGEVSIELELFVPRERPLTALRFRAGRSRAPARLVVRPLISCRDFHALHHENGSFRFDADVDGEAVVWRPYPGLPAIVSRSNGAYRHDPVWYRNFLYTEESARGLDAVEDLASPGVLTWDLSNGDAVWLLAAGDESPGLAKACVGALDDYLALRHAESRRRSGFASPRARAADAYVVRRGAGRTIIAGYPWFADWGRDAFIALRGLCLATGRLDVARDILLAWADAVSEGMLPNRFPDRGDRPEYNSVDASLWYVVAVGEFLVAAGGAGGRRLTRRDRGRLEVAVEAILEGYANGTRYGIRLDDDGLIAAGEEGIALTWMDARIDGRAVTPRIGKPVEVEALWLNALHAAGGSSSRFKPVFDRGLASFRERFWNPDRGCLFDVVDAEHVPGRVDGSLRPNQILAVGGLPIGLLEEDRARSVVEVVERSLLTPAGLRSLAPDEPGYAPRYTGGPAQRDAAYHQGTVWPWLLGPFVEAWVRVHGRGEQARKSARERFLEPWLEHLDPDDLGHLPEIADADPPHEARGCPFQAWSVGEASRLDLVVLAAGGRAAPERPTRGRPSRPRGKGD